MKTLLPTPALTAWRLELASRRRTTTTFDPLWKAACEDMHAVEAPTPGLAQSHLLEARRIIRAAAKGRAA
jgi:hypothetical protein